MAAIQRLTHSQLIALENISRPVDSEINPNVLICVRNDGQGMDIIEMTEDGVQDTPIHRDMIPILKEAIEIFEHLGEGVSFDDMHPKKNLRIVR